jgi:acyl-coenzyme A thioesterase PaaI-like protein
MPTIELPHTSGCLVCGRANPHGLHLSLHVDPLTGEVGTRLLTQPQHVGFDGIVHGGVLATVLDEAMVWAATWAGRRFCVCAEMTVRFKESAGVGESLTFTARVESKRSRLITTVGEARRSNGTVLVEAAGKYSPVPPERHTEFMGTFLEEPATREAAGILHPA